MMSTKTPKNNRKNTAAYAELFRFFKQYKNSPLIGLKFINCQDSIYFEVLATLHLKN